jgi:hypothetical protein
MLAPRRPWCGCAALAHIAAKTVDGLALQPDSAVWLQVKSVALVQKQSSVTVSFKANDPA